MQVGFVFLMMIAAFVIYSDIVKLLPRSWEEDSAVIMRAVATQSQISFWLHDGGR